MLPVLIRSLAGLLVAVAVYAAEDTPIFNQVHLEAQVEADVENDQLEVTMVAEDQGTQAGEIAAQVNETMQWALELARAEKGIEVSTRSYHTYPVYQDRFIAGWRAEQELHMQSKDTAKLTELVGKLQQRLQVRVMNFTPTKETRVKTENNLISEAMQAFRQRAEIVREHMDSKNYRIVDIHVSTGQSGPIMYREQVMSMAKMEDAAAPAVEAGTSKVIVTVTGSVQFF